MKLVRVMRMDNRGSAATVVANFVARSFREAFKHHIAQNRRGRYKQHWQL